MADMAINLVQQVWAQQSANTQQAAMVNLLKGNLEFSAAMTQEVLESVAPVIENLGQNLDMYV